MIHEVYLGACKKYFYPLYASPIKWSNTPKICPPLPMNCLSVFDHFVGLALKGLRFCESSLLWTFDWGLNTPLNKNVLVKFQIFDPISSAEIYVSSMSLEEILSLNSMADTLFILETRILWKWYWNFFQITLAKFSTSLLSYS